MATVSYGDAEAAVCQIVRGSSAVTALGTVTVTTDLIGYHAKARWVRVVRTGGVPTLWMHLDNPVIALSAFAPDKGAALDLAAAARGAVFDARGSYEGHGLVLYDVTDAEGMTWAPDESSGPRYTFSLSLVTRPSE